MESWVITKDLINEGEAVGNWNGEGDTAKECLKVCDHDFGLYDDDGVLYYQGKSSCSSSFAPLDDFGAPHAGCTDIRYLENGLWVSL